MRWFFKCDLAESYLRRNRSKNTRPPWIKTNVNSDTLFPCGRPRFIPLPGARSETCLTSEGQASRQSFTLAVAWAGTEVGNASVTNRQGPGLAGKLPIVDSESDYSCCVIRDISGHCQVPHDRHLRWLASLTIFGRLPGYLDREMSVIKTCPPTPASWPSTTRWSADFGFEA